MPRDRGYPSAMSIERVVRVFRSFEEAEAADLDEWMALSGDERLAIGEELSREAYGDGEPGLRRVLSIAERSGG
ncbi:MAG: hypothetical protein HZB39_01385 [Planctomycetes bacterium]|nr:hypothetical protein [Planctomycetota bacterium]